MAESPPCKATPVSSHAPGLSLFTVTGLIVILLWQLSLYCTVLATKRKGYGCMYHPLSQSELHTCLPGLLRTPVASEKCESSPTTVPPRLPCLSTTHVSCIKSCRAAAAMSKALRRNGTSSMPSTRRAVRRRRGALRASADDAPMCGGHGDEVPPVSTRASDESSLSAALPPWLASGPPWFVKFGGSDHVRRVYFRTTFV